MNFSGPSLSQPYERQGNYQGWNLPASHGSPFLKPQISVMQVCQLSLLASAHYPNVPVNHSSQGQPQTHQQRFPQSLGIPIFQENSFPGPQFLRAPRGQPSSHYSIIPSNHSSQGQNRYQTHLQLPGVPTHQEGFSLKNEQATQGMDELLRQNVFFPTKKATRKRKMLI